MSSDDSRTHPDDFIDEHDDGNIDDFDEDLAKDFFNSICNQVEENRVEEGGKRYQQWIFDGPRFESEVLRSISNTEEERSCVRILSLFYSLRKYPPPRIVGDQWAVFENIPEEYDDRLMYHYCKFLLYREMDDPLLREDAFVSGIEIAENIRTDPDIHYRVASLGLVLIQQTELSHSNYYGEQIDESTVLSMSAQFAEEAISGNSEISEYYLAYASLLEFQERFEEAVDILRQGRSLCVGEQQVLDPDGRYIFADDEISRYDERIEDVQKERRRYELEQSLQSADDKIDNLNSDLDSIEDELKETTEQFRTQIFQFIGFFAAILTIALTSVQIATRLTFPQSGGLILVLIGGITLSFGELNVLFGASSNRNSINIRSLIVGAALVAIGLLIGIFG